LFLALSTEISKSIPFSVLNECPREVKLLRYFAIFKQAYPNGKIYHYKGCWENRAKRTGISRGTFNTTVQRFIDKGWASKQGKTIILKGKHEISEQVNPNGTGFHRFVKIDTSQNIVDQLRAALLQTKINRIHYSKSRKEARNKKVRKKYLAHLRGAYTPISKNKLAEVFGGSKSNASNIVKNLKKAKLFKVKD